MRLTVSANSSYLPLILLNSSSSLSSSIFSTSTFILSPDWLADSMSFFIASRLASRLSDSLLAIYVYSSLMAVICRWAFVYSLFISASFSCISLYLLYSLYAIPAAIISPAVIGFDANAAFMDSARFLMLVPAAARAVEKSLTLTGAVANSAVSTLLSATPVAIDCIFSSTSTPANASPALAIASQFCTSVMPKSTTPLNAPSFAFPMAFCIWSIASFSFPSLPCNVST